MTSRRQHESVKQQQKERKKETERLENANKAADVIVEISGKNNEEQIHGLLIDNLLIRWKKNNNKTNNGELRKLHVFTVYTFVMFVVSYQSSKLINTHARVIRNKFVCSPFLSEIPINS